MAYDHITDPAVLAVLNGDISEDSICQALTATGEHLGQDIFDESLDLTVMKHRVDSYNDALHAWNVEGDLDSCILALEQYWN